MHYFRHKMNLHFQIFTNKMKMSSDYMLENWMLFAGVHEHW